MNAQRLKSSDTSAALAQQLSASLERRATTAEGREAVAAAARLLVNAFLAGDTCVDLDGARAPLLPGLRREPTLCAAPGSGTPAPLVLDGQRLYLARLWQKELALAAQLRALAAEHCAPYPGMAAALHTLFDAQAIDQRRACAIALTRRLGIVTGGPGTGKTTAVAKLLVLLIGDSLARGETPVIALTAPTGKAAARVAEALLTARDKMLLGGQAQPEVLELLPKKASTLHRLLGSRPDGSFRHGPGNPLAAHVVVVDECSMVDLRLFDALLQALRPDAHLLLLGDSNQLDAVEAGNVFGALCEGAGSVTLARAAELTALDIAPQGIAQDASAVNDATAVLQHSYRFDKLGAIGRLAAAVLARHATDAEAALSSDADGRITRICYDPQKALPVDALAQGFVPLLEALRVGATDADLLKMLDDYRVLTPLREGVHGIEGLNRAIEQLLVAAGHMTPARGGNGIGRPVLVTRNDHALQVFNGDLGLVVSGPDGAEQVLFRGPDGQPRRISPGRLPAFERAFAMTIHKSQGSESTRVAIVLPPAGEREFGSREMLYTAITRAKESLLLLMPEGPLEERWLRASERKSGLVGRLHG